MCYSLHEIDRHDVVATKALAVVRPVLKSLRLGIFLKLATGRRLGFSSAEFICWI